MREKKLAVKLSNRFQNKFYPLSSSSHWTIGQYNGQPVVYLFHLWGEHVGEHRHTSERGISLFIFQYIVPILELKKFCILVMENII